MTVPRSSAPCGPAPSRPLARPFSSPPQRSGRELAESQEWPLRSYLELPAVPACVPVARAHAKRVLREWRMDALADTVELIVSEMTTNAVRASAVIAPQAGEGGSVPPVRLWLTRDWDDVLIEVWDGNHRRPAGQAPEPDAESGRGLLLIEALSARWGCRPQDGQAGKIVWAVCSQ